MYSEEGGTAATPDTVRRRQEAKAKPASRPGGLAIGETYVYEDGLKIRVDRLGLLPQEPPQTIFDEYKQYVSAKAIRFEVTVTNDGGATASLSDLAVGVRAGTTAGRGTRPGTARGSCAASCCRGPARREPIPTACSPERRARSTSRSRGAIYSSDEKTQQVWTGAAEQRLFGEAEPGKGRLTQAQRDGLFAEAMRETRRDGGPRPGQAASPDPRGPGPHVRRPLLAAVSRPQSGGEPSRLLRTARHRQDYRGADARARSSRAPGRWRRATWSRRTGQTFIGQHPGRTPASRRTTAHRLRPGWRAFRRRDLTACTAATEGTPMRTATRRCRS